MRLIGITGKSGSGKTTFSDILAKNENIGVIHVDELLKEIKLKYFKNIMNKDKNGERTKVNSRLKTILYKNKILFNIFMRIRAKLIDKKVSQEIDKMQEQGKRVVLIDDTFLQHLKCYKNISLIFLMERPYVSRISSLMERDQMTKQELVAYDIAHTSGNYKQKFKNKNVIKIDNDKGQEDLIAEANRIYTYNFAPLRKRYRVDNYVLSKNNSQKEKMSKNREEEEK